MHALERAARRGVDVEILVPSQSQQTHMAYHPFMMRMGLPPKMLAHVLAGDAKRHYKLH